VRFFDVLVGLGQVAPEHLQVGMAHPVLQGVDLVGVVAQESLDRPAGHVDLWSAWAAAENTLPIECSGIMDAPRSILFLHIHFAKSPLPLTNAQMVCHWEHSC